MRVLVPMFALLMSLGCAEKLELRVDEVDESAKDDDETAELPDGIPHETGKIVHAARSGGGLTTVVNAVEESEWQYLDLDTALSDDQEDVWDLAFSRFRFRINGGISGPGAVQVAVLEAEPFDDVETAPDEHWSPERADSEGDTGDADSEPDNVFNAGEEDWYDYNLMNHTLTPKDITYVVASTDERFYKLRIESYYDSAGTDGYMRFDWDEVDAPSGGWPPADGNAR